MVLILRILCVGNHPVSMIRNAFELVLPAGAAHALGSGIILSEPVLHQCLEDRHPFLDQKFAAALGEHDGELAGGAGIGGCGCRAEMFEAEDRKSTRLKSSH